MRIVKEDLISEIEQKHNCFVLEHLGEGWKAVTYSGELIHVAETLDKLEIALAKKTKEVRSQT